MANQVRDKTLVLRVLVPSLETRLRDKMRETEEQAAKTARSNGGGSSATSSYTGMGIGGSSDSNNKETLFDLDGVTCEPIEDGSTLWNFHCDGANYPARLVNLPCPIELHKTHDHAMYYKAADVAQILIVYEDQMAMEEAEAAPGYRKEDYPSYYNSGLTPPLKNVVERRFAKREHKATPIPSLEVSEVEQELKEFIDRMHKDTRGGKAKQKNQQTPASNKIIEEVVEDIVEYEAWMDNYVKNTSYGFELEEKDTFAHPELWLDPAEVAKITKAESDKTAEKKKKKAENKKKKAKEEKEAKAVAKAAAKADAKEAAAAEAEAAAAAALSSTKNGNSKLSPEEMDEAELTQAATQMQMSQDINDEDLFFGDDIFDFSGDDLTSL